MGDTRDSVGQHLERVNRREIAVLTDGVAFAFGAAEPSESDIRKLLERFEPILDQVVGTDKRLLIDSYASSPGEDDYNQTLSVQRGEWVKGWLVEQGVDPRQIEVRSHGESNADQVGDSAYDRVALVQLENDADAITFEQSTLKATLKERFSTVADDREAGEDKYDALIGPSAEIIRELHALPENPVLPDPSANPVQLGKQALGVVLDFFSPVPLSAEDALADQVFDKDEWFDAGGKGKFGLAQLAAGPGEIAKGAGGIAIGLARENMRTDVADARQPAFDAMAAAVAAALDVDHNMNLESMDAVSRAIAIDLYSRLTGLSELDRYQIAIFLSEALRAGHLNDGGAAEFSYLERHLDGTTFRMAADSLFADPDFSSDSNDTGNIHLLGRTFAMVDGELKVVDTNSLQLPDQGEVPPDALASPNFDLEVDAASRTVDMQMEAVEKSYDMRADNPVNADPGDEPPDDTAGMPGPDMGDEAPNHTPITPGADPGDEPPDDAAITSQSDPDEEPPHDAAITSQLDPGDEPPDDAAITSQLDPGEEPPEDEVFTSQPNPGDAPPSQPDPNEGPPPKASHVSR